MDVAAFLDKMNRETSNALFYGSPPSTEPDIRAQCCTEGSQIEWCGPNGWCVLSGYGDHAASTMRFCPWCATKLPEMPPA